VEWPDPPPCNQAKRRVEGRGRVTRTRGNKGSGGEREDETVVGYMQPGLPLFGGIASKDNEITRKPIEEKIVLGSNIDERFLGRVKQLKPMGSGIKLFPERGQRSKSKGMVVKSTPLSESIKKDLIVFAIGAITRKGRRTRALIIMLRA